MATTNPGLATNEQQLHRLLASEKPLALIADDAPEERVTLPERIKSLLKQIITEFAHGREVTLLAREPEMTAQEAAEYLKLPLPYLMRLMNQGEIPFRMDGESRRLKLSEVKLYEKKMGKVVESPIKMRDMHKDMKWLSDHGRDHEGKWVAIHEDHLIASCNNAKDAYAAADTAGFPQTMVTFIEESLPNRRG
jgi:excisionase family DNA binding protein